MQKDALVQRVMLGLAKRVGRSETIGNVIPAATNQLCQRNCCGLRAEPCEITKRTRPWLDVSA